MANATWMDGFLLECVLPMAVLMGGALVVLGAFEVGGRIRAKIKGEEWVSPINWW